MALDDVVKAGRNYMAIGQANESLKNRDPNTLNDYLNYASISGEAVTENAMDLMTKYLSKPGALPQCIQESVEEEHKSLADTVSGNYQEVLNALSDDELARAALSIPDKNKDFYQIGQLVEAKQYDAVREAYGKTFENKVWKKIVKRVAPELLEQFASEYIAIQESKFIDKYSKEVKTEDGKTGKELDNDKLRNYIRETIEDYKNYGEDAQKIRDGAYVMLGQLYAMNKLGIKPQKQKAEGNNRNSRGRRRPRRR